VAAACVSVTAALTKTVPLWSFNGPVDALVVSGRTLYVGGHFTQVTPHTGPLLAVSASSGVRIPSFPSASDGAVTALLPDGRGGWFVGGQFDRLGGVACPNLAHVTASMTVDRRFCPRPNDAIDALALDGSTLYAGGTFTRIGTARRAYLAALNASTGRAASWLPPPIDDAVSGIAERNGVLYLLGDFGVVGGKHRFSLAAVDIRTRRVTAWDPKAPEGSHGQPVVDSIAATSGAIYVGGSFERVGGRPRSGLAALDPVTGRATGFVPSGKPWTVEALTVAGGRLYAGGFTHTGGYLASYDAVTGKAAAWKPPVDAGGVNSLAVAGSRVYAGGARLQAFDAKTGRRVPWAPPAPNQRVNALAAWGKTVVAGGTFTGAGGVTRDGLAALNLATGLPTSWHPRLTGSHGLSPAVTALALSGSTVYAGGDFAGAGGKPRVEIAAVDAATGQATGWAPQITSDNQVLAIGVGGSNVYFGGFGAASSYDTAGKLRWNSPPGGISASVNAIAVIGGTVYLGGSFDVIGGANRHALVAVDARNGSTTSWNPRVSESDGDEEVNALALSGPTLYVGGGFESVGGSKRHLLASFDTRTGRLTGWAPKPGDIVNVYALAVTPGAVYAGGDGGAWAFDPKTGAALNWHPSPGAGGGFSTPFVHAIAVAGSTVYVGDEAGLETFSR